MIRCAILFAAALALTGCNATPDAVGTAPAAATGIDSLVGRPLTQVDGQGSLLLSADGTGTGTTQGEPLFLSWTQEGDQFCRSGTLGATALQFECQTVQIMGNTVAFLRPDGTTATRYRIG
ncbi:hypothetical protein [Jannaschia pohangensis]|uniref:hypothetical protein n=1 Tax=Jannaschia pohangensis TaxID=390807 RepID=UPI000B82FA8C|nr:hypothetical protein [Jannaschia pohangensis]